MTYDPGLFVTYLIALYLFYLFIYLFIYLYILILCRIKPIYKPMKAIYLRYIA